MTDEARRLHARLDDLERKIEAILNLVSQREPETWIDRRTASQLLGISDRHLGDLVARGTISGDAVRNVGTIKKARYRFDRAKLINQYLARV